MIGRFNLALLLIAVLSLGQHWRSPVAHAATFTVNSTLDEHDAVPGDGICRATPSQKCTLRAAIEEANALSGFDTVTVPAGTYALNLGQLQTTSDISIEGAGSDTTIVQAGAQPYSGMSRVFRLGVNGFDGPGTRAVLIKLTVRHGAARNGESGGGILVAAETQALLDQVVVTGNHADSSGGGIFSVGDLTLRNAVVSNNRVPADVAGFPRGGGVKCVAPQEADISRVKLRIERSTIASNVAFTGGGVHANDCNVTISTSTIVGNTAMSSDGGGGVTFNELGTHALTNVTISGNATTGVTSSGSSRGGGGLMFTGDTASYNQPDSTLTMDHVTFFNNSSPTKTNGHNLVTIRPTRTEIRNSVLFHAQGYGINCTIPLTSRGGNLEFPGNSCFISPPASGIADLVNTDPKLLPLANNGGPTLTHALGSGSRAIDRIAFSASTCQPTDQRGLPRGTDGNRDGRPGCDSGAFEVQ